jgi:two-component system, sensor histidine kinase ChiS
VPVIVAPHDPSLLRAMLRVLCMVAATVWLAGCGARPVPTVQDGVLDLEGWSFHQDGPIRLNGPWRFAWQRHDPPDDLGPMPDRVDTRRSWNQVVLVSGEQIGHAGHGTYALKIEGLSETTPVALGARNSLQPYAIYAVPEGGRALRVMGIGDVRPDAPVPLIAQTTGMLPGGEGLELVLHVSNQHWHRGGFYQSLWMGTEAQIRALKGRFLFVHALSLGVILISGLYHLMLFRLRREETASLFFALLCLSQVPFWLAYIGALPELLALQPSLWQHLFSLTVIFELSYLAPPLFAAYLTRAFPRFVPWWLPRAAAAVYGILGVLCLVLGFPLSGHLNVVFGLASAVFGGSCLWFLIRAARSDHKGAAWAVAGFLLLGGAVAKDTYQAATGMPGTPLTPLGLAAFIFAQSYVISWRFARAHRRAEHLGAHLQDEVDAQTRELADAHEKLVELDAARTHFIQNVSHELRTPLTLILAVLQDRAADDADLAMAMRNAVRLLGLVNELLELQRQEAPGESEPVTVIDLSALAQSLADDVSAAATAQGVGFEVEAEVAVHTQARRRGLEKIAFNFLSNALKFSPEGAEIRLTVTHQDGCARLGVTDQGPGIRADDLERLFKPFVRLDPSVPGTGLGLVVARRIATSMGGTVGATSVPGEGSTFFVDLPATDATAEPAPPRDHAPLGAVDLVTMEVPMPPEIERHDPVPGAATVMVVDDVPDMRTLIAGQLAAADHRTVVASCGSDALAMAMAEPPDLVICDWMMPGLSGPEVIDAFRRDPRLSGIPIVLLTAWADAESRRLGTESGADAFVGKPFERAELLAVVRNLLALKADERLLRRAYADLEAAHQREQEVGEARLEQAETLASMGGLLSGLVAELDRPVSRVALQLEEERDLLDRHESAILRNLDEPAAKAAAVGLLEHVDELREMLTQSEQAIAQVAALRDALDRQRRMGGTVERVAVSALVQDALGLAGSRSRRYRIRPTFDTECTVAVVRTRVGRVLSSVLMSALDAVDRGDAKARSQGVQIVVDATDTTARISLSTGASWTLDTETRERSQRLLSSLGGDLVVRSDAPGSCVVVELKRS